RFVTSYPRDFGDDVLEVIRDHPRICRYLHVPAQTGSDRLLKLVNRGYEVGEYLEFLDRARGYLDQPEIGRPLMVSGDFIVGFPTETDDDFEASMNLLRRARYKNSFIFKYSPRPGTVAIDKFADDIPEDVKRARNNRMLAEQNAICDEISREQVGREFDVFIEGLSPRARKQRAKAAGAVALTIGGRAARDEAPAADAQLSARTDGDLIVLLDAPAGRDAASMIGEIVRVLIADAGQLWLNGVVVTG
ncbi:MAG: radical SAM protein, partial [Phycisphaerales bacterium]